jgi:hypothetical protein
MAAALRETPLGNRSDLDSTNVAAGRAVVKNRRRGKRFPADIAFGVV